MRTSQGSLLTAGYSRGVSPPRLVLAQTQKQAEEWESSVMGKGELQGCLAGGCCPRTRSWASFVAGQARVCGFPWP